MNIFNFRNKDRSDNQQGYNMSDGNEVYQPEAEESLGGRNTKKGKITTVDCGTNYPIDVIYSFINKDFEEKGFNDAMCNLDASYLQTGKDQIRNELISMFKQIKLKLRFCRVCHRRAENKACSKRILAFLQRFRNIRKPLAKRNAVFPFVLTEASRNRLRCRRKIMPQRVTANPRVLPAGIRCIRFCVGNPGCQPEIEQQLVGIE